MDGQIAFVTLVVPFVELFYMYHALSATVLTRPLNPSLVIVEYHSQKYVHEEEDSKHDEDNEIDRVPCASIICLKHDIREV